MAAIGGIRSDLSITRKTDGNFGNVSAGVLFSKVAYQAIPIKCFVSHRPPSREGGSVGRAKKKKKRMNT